VLIGGIVEKQSRNSCRMVENGKGPDASRGARNRITRELIERVEATGITPLDYMLAVLRDETAPPERRDEMAKAAAPFVHPRLQTTKVQGDKDYPLFDLLALSDSELAFLRRTVLKAQQANEEE
jgi:hypothetical protein